MTSAWLPGDADWLASEKRARGAGYAPVTGAVLAAAIINLLGWNYDSNLGVSDVSRMIGMLRRVGILDAVGPGGDTLAPRFPHSWASVRELLLTAKVAFNVERAIPRQPIIDHLCVVLGTREAC